MQQYEKNALNDFINNHVHVRYMSCELDAIFGEETYLVMKCTDCLSNTFVTFFFR